MLLCKWISLSFNYLWGKNGKVKTAHLKRETSLRGHIVEGHAIWRFVIGVTNIKEFWQLATAAENAASWTMKEMKKWSYNEVDTKKNMFTSTKQKDRIRQWESGDTGARSPRWVSGFYNWTLPHQWCCSTEGSRHLYTPVGICVIASHLELVAINWITPIIGP